MLRYEFVGAYKPKYLGVRHPLWVPALLAPTLTLALLRKLLEIQLRLILIHLFSSSLFLQ